jgi:hypothetical protein
MSYKPDEKDWMAYLYGELEREEKRKFDQYLLHNADARQELEKLQNMRNVLSGVADKEIIAPPIFIGDDVSNTPRSGQRYFWNTPYIRTIGTIAASLLMIILAGKLTGTRLSVSDNEVRLSFGEKPLVKEAKFEEPVAQSLSSEQVQQMINSSLAKNNEVLQAGLEETQKKLDASIRSTLATSSGRIDQLVREASYASQQQIRQFVDGIRTENMEHVKDYFQLTSTEQKKYIENLLVDFAKYLQQQRNDDLQLVQTRMNSLEQNTDILKHETEQILSSIITSVGNNPASKETRN